MKKLLYYSSLLLMVVIPLSIIYFQYEIFAVTSAQHLQIKLADFLHNYRYDIQVEGTDWFFVTKALFWFIIGMRVIDTKFMGNRISGLKLLERRGDWILSIWFILKVSASWYAVYWASLYLGINTDSVLESINWVFYCVGGGIFFKMISTYLYSVE